MNWLIENIEAVAAALVPLTVIAVLVGILVKTQVTRVFAQEVEQ
jgi:hypothetical protein